MNIQKSLTELCHRTGLSAGFSGYQGSLFGLPDEVGAVRYAVRGCMEGAGFAPCLSRTEGWPPWLFKFSG